MTCIERLSRFPFAARQWQWQWQSDSLRVSKSDSSVRWGRGVGVSSFRYSPFPVYLFWLTFRGTELYIRVVYIIIARMLSNQISGLVCRMRCVARVECADVVVSRLRHERTRTRTRVLATATGAYEIRGDTGVRFNWAEADERLNDWTTSSHRTTVASSATVRDNRFAPRPLVDSSIIKNVADTCKTIRIVGACR